MIVMIFKDLSEIEFLVTGGSARLAMGTGRWPFLRWLPRYHFTESLVDLIDIYMFQARRMRC